MEKDKYLEYLIEEYSDMVYRLAMSRTRKKEASEDVYQEVFLRIAKKLPEFENKEHEKAWLIRVTINCSKNILMDKFTKHTAGEELCTCQSECNSSLQNEMLPDKSDEKNDLYYAVLDLPLKYRTVIHLFYYEGYKIEEISRMLKIKESTIKSQLLRAREMLKVKVKGGIEDG